MEDKSRELCKFCGTHLANEREMFENDKLFTGHSCQGIITNLEVFRVLNLLRRNGISRFVVDDITTDELDDAVKGYG